MKWTKLCLRSVGTIVVLLLAGSARSDEPPTNKLTAEQIAEGWVPLFDGVSVSEWHIEGDHQIVDGVLILGGKQQTRAYLKAPVQRNFELRFQYRTEGKESAGVGWDFRSKTGQHVPGVTLPVLEPKEDWYDSFLVEYFDVAHWQQRFIKSQGGTSGVFLPIASLWLEVPAGTKLYLRNLRLKPGQTAVWPWFLALPVMVPGLIVLFVWRRKKGRLQAARDRAEIAPS